MGGGHGHDFGPRFKIPDYKIYKVEDAPRLVTLRNVLAQKGLKDPWIRNEVWRHDPKEWGTHSERLRAFFFRGFKYGFAAFLATIAVEAAINKMSPPSQHGSHH